jgi:hypothetical protein
MGYLTYYGFKNGNISKLVAPLDADSNFCGQDNFTGYDYLYLTNLNTVDLPTIFSSGVCV